MHVNRRRLSNATRILKKPTTKISPVTKFINMAHVYSSFGVLECLISKIFMLIGSAHSGDGSYTSGTTTRSWPSMPRAEWSPIERLCHHPDHIGLGESIAALTMRSVRSTCASTINAFISVFRLNRVEWAHKQNDNGYTDVCTMRDNRTLAAFLRHARLISIRWWMTRFRLSGCRYQFRPMSLVGAATPQLFGWAAGLD